MDCGALTLEDVAYAGGLGTAAAFHGIPQALLDIDQIEPATSGLAPLGLINQGVATLQIDEIDPAGQHRQVLLFGVLGPKAIERLLDMVDRTEKQ